MQIKISRISFKQMMIGILIFLILTVISYVTFYYWIQTTEPFYSAKTFLCEDNLQVEIYAGGNVKCVFSFWDHYSYTSHGNKGDAEFAMKLTGDKGVAHATVKLNKNNTSWEVYQAYMTLETGKVVELKPQKLKPCRVGCAHH
jgi:hypothetical protein